MADIKHALVADGDPLVGAADWNAAHTIEDGSIAFAKLVGAAASSHSHAGEDITSGTVADARVASTIARDSEITATKLDDFAAPDDNTDLNASMSAHGLLPKLDNNSAHFLNGQGSWATPSGSGGVASDPIWDAAGDLAVGTGADTAAKLPVGAAGTVPKSDGTTLVYGTPGEFASANNIVATNETLTGNNSWVNLTTTGPAVTVVVGASGKVKITLTAHISGGAGGYGDMGFAASGANTIAAGVANKVVRASGPTAGWDMILSATFVLTGLSTGSTTFTAKYNQQGGGGTTAWSNREIIVEPVI